MRESEIITLFLKHLKKQGDIPLGDDAGAFRVGDEWLVITNDMLVGKTDVPNIMTPEEVGFKAVTMNVSDIAAMGARPIGFLFSIGIPGETSSEYLEGIAKGIGDALNYYNLPVISADTNEAGDLIIDGAALGITGSPLLRSGARPGDLVCITGDIGRALAGYLVWRNGVKIEKRIRDVIYEKFLRPIARVEAGLRLSGVANSAVDVSDGLSKELHLLAEKSGVRIDVAVEKLPIMEEVFEVSELLGMDPYILALGSGEEFELLFTLPPEKVADLDFQCTVIGRVVAGEGVYYRRSGKLKEMPLIGWEHLEPSDQKGYRSLFR